MAISSVPTTAARGCSSRIVMLLAAPADERLPASVRLTTGKGPARSVEREPWHLRSLLHAPTTTLNCVHSPDEPIDVLREMPILFSPGELREALKAARQGTYVSDADVRGLVHRLYRSVPERPLEPQPLLDELQDYLGPQASWPVRLSQVSAACAEAGRLLTDWEMVLLGATIIVNDLPDVHRLVPKIDHTSWEPEAATRDD